MAWIKTRTAIVAGAGVLIIALTATVLVKEYQLHRTYPWQVPQADFNVLYKSPPMVVIVPTKFNEDGGRCADSRRGAMGIAKTLKDIIEEAYQQNNAHTAVLVDLPTNRYDFIAKLVGPSQPHQQTAMNTNWAVALQKQIVKQFGLAGKLEIRDTPVLLLKPGSPGVHGFTVGRSMPNGRALGMMPKGGVSFFEQPISPLIVLLQQHFQTPIVDQTGLKERYDYSLTWNELDWKHPNLEGLKQALREQLGLELMPTNMPTEMLVVEKVK